MVNTNISNYALGAMRLAMHCNLHSIPSLKVSDYSPSVLPPPENDMEVRDRMAAFWFTFILDRGGRVARGRRVIAPDEVTCRLLSLRWSN
jgi:hypothetical protein